MNAIKVMHGRRWVGWGFGCWIGDDGFEIWQHGIIPFRKGKALEFDVRWRDLEVTGYMDWKDSMRGPRALFLMLCSAGDTIKKLEHAIDVRIRDVVHRRTAQ